jgi:hypothetical protein
MPASERYFHLTRKHLAKSPSPLELLEIPDIATR